MHEGSVMSQEQLYVDDEKLSILYDSFYMY